jgi:GT2 family glycosyltransferase
MLSNLIIPVLNRYDLLQRMLNSVDEYVEHLLIIDNGGMADSLKFPETVNHVHFLQLPSNLGVAASWNLGIKLFPHHERWFFASNDMVFHPGGMRTLAEAARNEITLCNSFPGWQTFAVGDIVVNEIGLFDEGLYPAYFEDNDYHRRAVNAGFTVRGLDIANSHDNSSTINSDMDLMGKNSITFAYNAHYYQGKVDSGDYSQGGWQLHRRREAAWDKPR